MTAFASQTPGLIKSFQDGRDIYATIASIAFKVPYENCLEFHPETHEYQPDGKQRRSIAKVIVLGLNYGMSVASIGQDVYGSDDSIPDEEKTKRAQEIFDAVMTGFPELNNAIKSTQYKARTEGYTETITGRRRYHPDMQLPYFEFKPMKGYTNPDIDPLDPDTLKNREQIPQRIIDQLTKELSGYKYKGQVYKRIKQLREENIEVINNSSKIEEASRKCWNAVVQGSAADLTKMAILRLSNSAEWRKIHGRFLCPVHDELIVEVPYIYKDQGAQILKESMEQAGSFLPFKISCDIEMTFRWYGLGVDDIEQFTKPSNLDWNSLSESNISWIQCMLNEVEYILPTYKDAEGNKPIGIAARGVNGILSDEVKGACYDYMKRNQLKSDTEFLDYIEKKVLYGAA